MICLENQLSGELINLTQSMESSYADTIYNWNKTRRVLFLAMFGVLILLGFWAFIYSHRLAGPLYRIQKNIDELVRGEDIPPVVLRKNDEFKELGASLENLRLKIREMENAKS